MENSDGQYNECNEHAALPRRNLSDSELQLEEQPVNPNDADTDLHIIGFKVLLDDEAYTFTLDKASNGSSDILTIAADSNELINQKMTEADPVEDEAIRDFLNVTNSSEIILSKRETKKSKVTINEEELENSPVLKLKVCSSCLESNKIEVRIKSSGESISGSSIDEQQCLNGDNLEKDQLTEVARIYPSSDGSHCVKYLKDSSTIPLKSIAEMPLTEAQTDTETDFVITQTNTEVQTEKETDRMHLQTEIGDFFRVEQGYDASTQTEETGNTIFTDIKCYLADKKSVAEKSVDTEGLSFDPQTIAVKEKAEMENKQSEENCQCSCGHQKQHDCIYQCCYHRDSENIIPTSILLGHNLQFLASMHTSYKCNICRCLLNKSCSESTKNCSEKLKSDIHPQYCCKCAMNTESGTASMYSQTETSGIFSTGMECDASTQTERQTENVATSTDFNYFLVDKKNVAKKSIDAESKMDSNPSTNEIEELEQPESIKVESKKFHSLAKKETSVHLPQVEIVQTLESLKEKTCVATEVFKPTKIDKAHLLKMPMVFEHYLSSSSLSKLSRSKMVINPIDIMLREKRLSENVVGEQVKSITKSARDCSSENRNESCQLPITGEIEKKSMEDDDVASSSLASYYSNSEMCPCNMCHPKNEIDDKKENNILQKHSSGACKEEKNKSPEKILSTTSPKIKSEDFDYISKDGWKPSIRKSDEFVRQKIEALDVINLETTSHEDSFNGFNINDACEIVNNHLLSLCQVDGNAVRKAAEMLHKRWFEVAGSKNSDVHEVKSYIQYFKEFSNNLVKSLLHSVDNNGNNVLHFAFANNKFDIVDEFLQNGFALDLLCNGNKLGNTPLMVCAISKPKSCSDWTVVRKCFEFSDVNQTSAKNSQTPLMNAASSGCQAMVDLLLDLGANPNLQDVDGSTALMYAAEHGEEKCAKSLVRHKKCDPTIKDKDGETACSIALSNGHKNVAVLIHMHALEKRRLSKNVYSTKRFIWTSSKTARKKTSAMISSNAGLSCKNY